MAKKKAKILEYNAIFTAEKEGGYSAYVPDLPGCVSQGETFEEAKKNIQEAIELYLEASDNDLYQRDGLKLAKGVTTSSWLNIINQLVNRLSLFLNIKSSKKVLFQGF